MLSGRRLIKKSKKTLNNGRIFLSTNDCSNQAEDKSPISSLSFFSKPKRSFSNKTPNALVDEHLMEVLEVMNEQSKIQAHCFDRNNKGCVGEFSWLPKYLIKLHPIERIAGEERLNACISKENLDLLIIPRHHLYAIPESYNRFTALKHLCIAEKIEGTQDGVLQSKQAKQLLTLIQKTGTGEVKARNLVHCDNGQIALIDTESFWNRAYGIAFLFEQNKFTKDAKELVQEEFKKYWPNL